METESKKSLLERYGIPIHHLDFKYIENCKNGREMEKIVHILRSNEEGYYPDLNKCAEEKLRELKPQSRLFRVEEQIKGRESLEPNELKPIYDWNIDIKATDKELQKLVKEEQLQTSQMPPIRKGGKIFKTTNTEEQNPNNNKTAKPAHIRIKSTDYNKWDQYDAEEEILRIDLEEERQQEQVESKNRFNMNKLKRQPLAITEIPENELENPAKWSNLSEIEKQKLYEDYRLRGNEYFRSKEYDQAITEYTKAIQCHPDKAVAAYNNRALTYFKQQKFLECIQDCEECLKIEASNVKANLRLAEAHYAYGRRRKSYQLYINVLKLDPENSVALKATAELRKQFEDLPPPNATRLQIHDESNNKTDIKPVSESNDIKPQPKPQVLQTKTINYDLADLVQPSRLVPNKLVKAAEKFGQNVARVTHKNPTEQNSRQLQSNGGGKIKLPFDSTTKNPKLLIEEL